MQHSGLTAVGIRDAAPSSITWGILSLTGHRQRLKRLETGATQALAARGGSVIPPLKVKILHRD
jgi:hypothetical protein